jgi:DNA ligase (NAD+)
MKKTIDTQTYQSVEDIAKAIQGYQEAYYNANEVISDDTFDALWDELKRRDPNHPLLSEIGMDNSTHFPKRAHKMMMGSQHKASNSTEIINWLVKQDTEGFVLECKLDGASIELQYEDGILQYGVTRGDGKIGDDITKNAEKMQGCIKTLRSTAVSSAFPPFSGSIRGEVIMMKETFETHYSDKANPRNAAAGIMKRLDGVGCEHLEIMVYDLSFDKPPKTFDSKTEDSELQEIETSEIKKLELLESFGFTVVPHNVVFYTRGFSLSEKNSNEELWQKVCAYREFIAEKRDILPFIVDGVVVKSIQAHPEDLQRDRPKTQIAFKFDNTVAITTLRAVEWSISGKHRTPVAICDPVMLNGTTVQRASLANPNLIKKLGIGIGSKVELVKRGDIIPKIIGCVTRVTDTSSKIVIPDTCTICGTTLVAGSTLYCPNNECPETKLHRVAKWVKVHNIMHIGTETLNACMKAGKVAYIKDLYTLDRAVYADLFGLAMGFKIYDEIHKANSTTLAKFIAGFDLDSIGVTLMTRIQKELKLKTLDDALALTPSQVEKVPGIGHILSESLISQLAQHSHEMRELQKWVLISNPEMVEGTGLDSSLAGKVFCFTGALHHFTRTEASKMVKDRGGTVTDTISKQVTYLVTTDILGKTAKYKKAKNLGITILSEGNFIRLLEHKEILEEVTIGYY